MEMLTPELWTETLLASREEANSRPILVVCMTNHALDNFLDDLRSAGLTRFARLGRGSREQWTKFHSIFALSRNVQQSVADKKKLGFAKTQLEGTKTVHSPRYSC